MNKYKIELSEDELELLKKIFNLDYPEIKEWKGELEYILKNKKVVKNK